MLVWIIYYLLISLFHKWILSWGGAEFLEGWKSFFAIGWFAWDWTAEQIKLYTLISWIMFTILFIIGCFNADIRHEYFYL